MEPFARQLGLECVSLLGSQLAPEDLIDIPKIDGNVSRFYPLAMIVRPQERLAGLFARHAGREPYKVTARLEARVLEWTTKRKPSDGSTHWSSRKLAAELGGAISHTSVARIWATHGIKPHRLEGYVGSNDPDFESKSADVIGPAAHSLPGPSSILYDTC
ncbi:mobile element protein [Caldimonas brevitalea]|uniref:Mobile element protein n=1 Tax=Caldimonas brevitalea TaxID=413882 RepID=A0A0G3BIW8_9BURK|nr:mobile element protein [Caldimonas brevitalea]